MVALLLAVVAAAAGSGGTPIVTLPGDGGGRATYRHDVRVMGNRARRWVVRHAGQVGGSGKGRMRNPDARRPAVVLDIDETSLASVTGGGALPPTLRLYRAARRHGVRVFFVTGRDADRRAETVRQLRAAGYTRWSGLTLEPLGSTVSVSTYKTRARRRIERRGFVIIANVGDQRSDLRGGHARRAFKYPNPFYTIP